MSKTFGHCAGVAPHRSFFRERLCRLAGGLPVEGWLIEEANLRGIHGATVLTVRDRPRCATLSNEELVVALLMPHVVADGRLFKLVVRMLQLAPLDPKRLWLTARREQADGMLYWLLTRVPATEQTPALEAIRESHPAPPRGYRGVAYEYDTNRLLRRAATKESIWRAARRSS